MYDKIRTETRHAPGYYRVSYYGNGFPSFLSNKTFIYRGKEYEMLGEFSSRIRELFPHAKVLTTLNAPSQEILESAGKCILELVAAITCAGVNFQQLLHSYFEEL